MNETALNLIDADPNKSILGNPSIKTRNFCSVCEVEYTWSVMRRYQLGYIKLISPVSHVWYLKGNPSYLSILLDIKKRHLEYVTYCSESLTIENGLKGKTTSVSSSDIVSSWNKLKEQIIYEKTIKLNETIQNQPSVKTKSIEMKLKKRRNLNIKRQNAWVRFKADGSETQLIQTKKLLALKNSNGSFKTLNANTNSNNKNQMLSQSNAENDLILINNFKSYFNNINIQSLLRLYTILNQIKLSQRNNNLETLFSGDKSPKQILKNLSIPFYILFKLKNSYEIYSWDLISQVWLIFLQKGMKNALIRSTNIIKKLDGIYFQKRFLNDTNFDLGIKPIDNGNLTNSLNLSRDYLKSIKNSVNNLSYQFLNYEVSKGKSFKDSRVMPLLKEQKKISELYFSKQDLEKISFEITNQQILLKNELNLKFYTLSKFSIKDVRSLLKNKTSYEILNFKPFLKSYNILFKKLSNIFLKMLLKEYSYSTIQKIELKENSSNKLVGVAFAKGDQNHFNVIGQSSQESSNQKGFNETLNLFHRIHTSHEKTLSHFLDQTNFLEQDFLRKISRNNQKESSLKNSNNVFNFNNLKIVELNKGKDNAKKLYNNIYSLSHRERWEGENDWNFLYYFMTSLSFGSERPIEEGSIIPNYKVRHNNINEIAISSENDDSTLNFSGLSSNLQQSAFFSGPGIIQQLLREFDFYEIKKMDKQNRILLYQLNKQIFNLKPHAKHDRSSKKSLKEAYKKRDLLIRRTKLIRKLFIKESSPESIILTTLPVLPPDLRPIVKMGGQIAASDLNRLYQRVIYRNDRLKKFLKDPATSYSYEMKYAQRLLQEAVDNLIQNGKSGVISEKDSRGRALKSLSDILKGKQGRFRQYLLGKRVDYSGRSVIVVGPRLKLHECGIPKEMALELYLPFLLKRILNENLSKTVVGAKTLIKTNPSLVWELLREIMQTCPVLLNRAPTLHRLGIQSFQPKLIEGRAILLHPLVCSAFNADFDGDQMAVHVPITVEARAEAWKLMLSRNNILSPATGDPLAIPSQDMVLGCYYLTTNLLNKKTQNFINPIASGFYYSAIKNVLRDFNLKKVDLHSNIWLKWSGLIENGMDQEEPIEVRVDSYGNWREISNKNQKIYNYENQLSAQYILTTPGKILFNDVIQKCLKN